MLDTIKDWFTNLTDKQRKWVVSIIVTLILTVLSVTLGIPLLDDLPWQWRSPLKPTELDEPVELGTTHFTNVSAEDLTATDDLTVTDDAAVGGDLSVTGTAAFSGISDVGTFLNLSEQTAISVTADSIITPTGTYQPLTSAAAVTTSTSCAVYTGTNTGDVVILCNENASDAIIIDDGANTALGGNKTLTGGQGDCITLLWDGADWVATGYNDN